MIRKQTPATSTPYLTWFARSLDRYGAEGARGESRAVLGYATGYGAAALEPFIRSLRSHYNGPAVLVVDDRQDVRRLLAAFGVSAADALPSTGWSPHPVVARFAAYDRWLRARPWVSHALLTDVRDVVFQGDPFAGAAARVEVYAEGRGRLADHPFTMKHLRALAGMAVAETISDRPSLCVGTIVGPAADLSRLCRVLLALAAIPRSEVGASFGADQAAFNLAVHLGLVDVDIRPNYGRVATIGAGDGGAFEPGEAGAILNPDGSASPIVHQYDRHAHLSELVRQRWSRSGHSAFAARRKSPADRWKGLLASLRRRIPELR
ncbi:hypothetical protein [Brevundimonas sp.]|uniref:hypothetical protein n=1 Tax=Brevundimonas sp. TaxID=1871086 RepID=UPI002D338642|nr:hypothetical protein [Brevundimonas sp.]HYC99484.1 hypothetical protein [Brevundimonas sp.]